MVNADADLERMMARAAEVQRGIAAIRGVGESPDGTVQVTVDAAGRIRDLTLADALIGTALPDLAAAIVRAHTAACDLAAENAIDLERVLRDDPYVAAVTNELASAGLAFADESDSRATEQIADITKPPTNWDNPAAVAPPDDTDELDHSSRALEPSW